MKLVLTMLPATRQEISWERLNEADESDSVMHLRDVPQ